MIGGDVPPASIHDVEVKIAMMTPVQMVGFWFRGLLSIAILVGGVYLLARWYDRSHVVVPALSDLPEEWARRIPEADRAVLGRREFRFEPGWNRATLELGAGLGLLIWGVLGRVVDAAVRSLTMRSGVAAPESAGRGAGGGPRPSKKERRRIARGQAASSAEPAAPEAEEDPRPERTGEVRTIQRPDGSVLRVECYGPADAPPIVWTHGWGADSTAWFYAKRHLARRFRLIVWDEPGLGLSRKPDNNDYRLENLAADLEAVLDLAGNRPAVLVGHSIGGMITLTLCKESPGLLGTRVAGLVLAHTSYTNPVRTAAMAGLWTALEKPLIYPLMHLTIGLWPLAWVMGWLNYFNGSSHRMSHKSAFSGNETKGQLDQVAGFMPRGRPDIMARGMLGMMRYDASATLARIAIPTLVVVGDLDTTTKPEAGRHIAETVIDGRLVTLSPARHLGLIEHHETFDRAVAEFVNRCQPKPARA